MDSESPELADLLATLVEIRKKLERMVDGQPAPDRGAADVRAGYRFGCDGTVSLLQAADLLGGASLDTVKRRIAEGCFRTGREGNRIVICRRSLMNYIATLED